MLRAIRFLAPAATAASVVLAVLAWSEAVTQRASRADIPAGRRDPELVEDGEAILVLGFASRADGRLNAVQRWRVRIAVRSTDRRSSTFVFSGGAQRAGVSEAALMASYAVRELGVPLDNVLLEERSTTTWENIAFSVPLLRDAPAIKIASNTFHARRARRYLAKQAPELAARLRPARDYLPGELAALKPVLAAYEGVRSAGAYLRTRRRRGADG